MTDGILQRAKGVEYCESFDDYSLQNFGKKNELSLTQPSSTPINRPTEGFIRHNVSVTLVGGDGFMCHRPSQVLGNILPLFPRSTTLHVNYTKYRYQYLCLK